MKTADIDPSLDSDYSYDSRVFIHKLSLMEHGALLSRVKTILSIPWEGDYRALFEQQPELEDILRALWYATVAANQRDDEASYSGWEDREIIEWELGESTNSELAKILEYAWGWRNGAVDKFSSYASWIIELRMATSADYHKHFVRMNMSNVAVENLSLKTHESKFYSSVQPSALAGFAHSVLIQYFKTCCDEGGVSDSAHYPYQWREAWSKCFGKSTLILHANYMRNVGASEGQPTSFVCLNVNFDTH
ncbi:MAG: hypothetical protein PF904_20790 [Kiritimatiellae bacterium]|jgi:hypothetical protein|nr:hypothetical protein [Kiritimatiellia bacterium]